MRVFLWFGLFVLCFALNAQFDPTSLLSQLDSALLRGEVRALRDVGTLLEKPPTDQRARQLLSNYTLFDASEIVVDQRLTKIQFLNFYYQNSSHFQYSSLLQGFYLRPVETQEVKYDIRPIDANSQTGDNMQLRQLIKNYKNAAKSGENLLPWLYSIAYTRLPDAHRFLLRRLEEGKEEASQTDIYRYLAEAISQFPNQESLTAILQATQRGKISPDFAKPLLRQLTNINLKANSVDQLLGSYQHLLDSLKQFDALRQYGYEQSVGFPISFFDFPVDFYGKILSQSPKLPWIQFNAVYDILQTEHPRSLFYVAAQIFQHRNSRRNAMSSDFFLQWLKRKSGIEIAVENAAGDLTFEYDLEKDEVARQNFVRYWASHYDDYEWDAIRKKFVNKELAVAQNEIYERLFRRLNSSNDSVALHSYLELSQGNPIEVIKLTNKYKELLRSYNRILPSFKHRYLEQVVLLTDFCKHNGFPYLPDAKIIGLLIQLDQNPSEQERFALENLLFSKLNLENITALEYWGILQSNKLDYAFSVGVLLDKFYSKNWNIILEQEDLLRLYLKKSALFSEIGVIGVCNEYLHKFGTPAEDLRQQLIALAKIETDKDIISQISLLLAVKKSESSLYQFMDNPLQFSTADVQDLSAPNPDEYAALFDVYKMTDEATVLKKLTHYIGLHLKTDMVPFIIYTLPLPHASAYARQLLKKLYHFELSVEEWLALWSKNPDDFPNWSSVFFKSQLENLNSKSKLNINEINTVSQSNLYRPEYKDLVLKSLAKLDRVRDVRRLKIEPALSIANDLKYFEDFDFSYKELDDIPKLFNTSADIEILLAYLGRKAASFEMEEQGSFYNNLFRANWFANYVTAGKLPEAQARLLKTILTTYLNESSLISEFEEQAILLNLALLNNVGKSLKERLQSTFALNADDAAKAKIQAVIIAGIGYDDIPMVLNFYEDWSPALKYNFLNKDFGLPIFELEDSRLRKEVVEWHSQHPRRDFYIHFLKRFGVDFLDAKNELDFEKIYKILKFDIVTPFVNGGGSQRDYFTYGIIKLLELEFKTLLGFHEKLNENQTFYSISAVKRAAAWMEFLEQKQLIKQPRYAPSF